MICYATDNSAYSTSASWMPLFPPDESFLEKMSLIILVIQENKFETNDM